MRDDGHHLNRGGGLYPAPRLTLRADLATAEGEPRICIAWPGRVAPLVFAKVAAMPGADLLGTALARADLSPKARAFLLDVKRQAARRPPTPRQMQAVERIATTAPRADFAAVNRAALARLPEVLARLLPGGRALGAEWHAGSLSGEPGDSLRVRLHGERAGVWCDFATGDRGGDPVSLAAAMARVPQAEAARRLARMLSIEGCHNG